MYVDMPLDELRAYAARLDEPADWDRFWADTLEETRRPDVDVVCRRVETVYVGVETYDVTFRGFGGDPIRAWLRLPAGRLEPLPVVVQFHGYQGGRGHVVEPISWTLAGFAHLSVDNRGQGASWQVGATPDPYPGTGPEHPGFMTRGVLDPSTYYYRRLFADAARAVDAARAIPQIDPARVLVAGGSQGGAIALAAAALVPDVAGAMIDVPFLSDIARALTITDEDPYAEVVRYLRIRRDDADAVLRTLSYIDGVTMARRAQAPALFSVALMDPVCPPSTVYAAFNAYAGAAKEIVEYPWNQHEGGQLDHEERKLVWALDRVGPSEPGTEPRPRRGTGSA